jgi:hypothetical protein
MCGGAADPERSATLVASGDDNLRPSYQKSFEVSRCGSSTHQQRSSTEFREAAVAHEVGHLLMGTAAHSPRGLMRALWSEREIHRSVEADWEFSSHEALRMRERIAARQDPS